MRRFFSALAVTAALLPGIASAATAGDLLKASGDAVYYFGANGKRYVFPTAQTYRSWYTDFSQVKTIGDAELATYPLGGNVTYRPGVRLVKVTTDPKVYAVGANGELRWITSESVAVALYGATWNTNVDDLPDAFFVNYRMGAPIQAASDFQPATETARASSINVDKGLLSPTEPMPPAATSTPPAPTPLPGTGSAYRATIGMQSDAFIAKGGKAYLRADVTPGTSLAKVKIFVKNSLLTTCTYTPCTGTFQLDQNDDTRTFPTRVEASWITGQTATATSSFSLSDPLDGITFTMERAQVRTNGRQVFSIDVDPLLEPSSIDVYVGGVRYTDPDCSDSLGCTVNYNITSPAGTTLSAYARIEGGRGNVYATPVQTFTVGTHDGPTGSILLDKTRIYPGESLDVRVTAADDNGIAWIEVYQGDVLLKKCQNTISCVVTSGPHAAGTISFRARIQDMLGATLDLTSDEVLVQ